jgi:uncharacterized protein YbjT (DUF2867 family)
MSHILVIGASRGIGLETVRAALATGHHVRALARSAASIPVENPRLEKIAGDALDPPVVERALQGVDGVIQALGVAFGPATLIGGTTLFSRATRVLVDAMRFKGVARLVVVTGLGAGDSRGHGGLLYDSLVFPLFLKRVYDDKDVQEQIIKSSGLDWTIARPGLLRDGPATGRARALADPAAWRAGSVRRTDVAAFLVDELESRAFAGRTPLLIE